MRVHYPIPSTLVYVWDFLNYKFIYFIWRLITLQYCIGFAIHQPVHSKGDQPWVFFGRNDAKAETPVLWPPHAKRWHIGKDSDAGRDWGQEEKGTTEDEMAEWHHWLDGRESQWTPGVGDGRRGLACCDSWVAKSRTWLSNWSDLVLSVFLPGKSHGQKSLEGYNLESQRVRYDWMIEYAKPSKETRQSNI